MASPLYVLCVLGMASVVSVQGYFTDIGFELRNSPCPNIPQIGDFNMSRYSGVWYERKRFQFALQSNVKCMTYTLFERNDGGFNLVYYREVRWPLPLQTSTRIVLEPTSKSGTFRAKTRVNGNWVFVGVFTIVQPGYEDPSVMYACRDLFYGTAIEASWIVKRDRQALTPTEESTLQSAVTSYGISYSKYQTSDQSSCGR
ncbi:apolipoprotein D-like [Ylistrum balloti]|uniref:apolipoprotein D-like n=1 Tax=Ylistrum balloti TaxID=509963 RepID=UPI002905BD01|nr:apolipoprotein D-like [Ylistrum balloti]